MRTPRLILAATLSLAASFGAVAARAQTALSEPVLPTPPVGPVMARFTPFATLPSDGGTPARVQFLTPAADGTTDLFALDEVGVIYRISADGGTVTTYLDLRAQPVSLVASGGEQGLVGLAFHPNFAGDPAQPGYGVFYTQFSAARGSGTPNFLANDDASHDQVTRAWFATDPRAATFSGTSREILRVGKFAENHNGGVIRFNPNARPGSPDYGALYIGLGDGGGGNDPRSNGQNLTVPLGKILRILPATSAAGPQYTAPPDNPFPAEASAGPLIWAYGFRNPQQFVFETGRLGRLFEDDIGQNQVEEVNIVVRGGNYGWQLREGTFATAVGLGLANGKNDYGVYSPPANDASNKLIYPIAEYDHSDAAGDGGTVAAAIGSGFPYHGSALPALDGSYVFTDFVQGRLFSIPLPVAYSRRSEPISLIAIQYDGEVYDALQSSPLGANGRADLRLGQDASGELYALSKATGAIYRVEAPR